MNEKVYCVFLSTLQSGGLVAPGLTLIGVVTDTNEAKKIEDEFLKNPEHNTDAHFYTVECKPNEVMAVRLI